MPLRAEQTQPCAACPWLLCSAGAYDDDEGMEGPGGARRGAFPVTFGKQNPKHLKVIAEAQ